MRDRKAMWRWLRRLAAALALAHASMTAWVWSWAMMLSYEDAWVSGVDAPVYSSASMTLEEMIAYRTWGVSALVLTASVAAIVVCAYQALYAYAGPPLTPPPPREF